MRPILPGIQRQRNYKLCRNLFQWFVFEKGRRNTKRFFSNIWSGTSCCLLKFLLVHNTSNSIVCFFIAALIYLKILSSSLLVFSSFICIVCFIQSFLRGLCFVGLPSIFFLFWPFFTWSKGRNYASQLNLNCNLLKYLPSQPQRRISHVINNLKNKEVQVYFVGK